MSDLGETRTESELHKQGAEMVRSMFTMPSATGEPTQGNTFYNNLERHSHIKNETMLYMVLNGTIYDVANAYKAGFLQNRVDLLQSIVGGWNIHVLQSMISMDRGGRKEAVEVLKAVAMERQALLEAGKGSRLAGLKQALVGHK